MSGTKAMLVIQDETYSDSLHLDEVLLSLIPSAECGAAAFAFATRDGLNAIFNSVEFKEFCRQGHHFELYIGIDDVTNDRTLEYAKQLSLEHSGRLTVKVYYRDDEQTIFHPKTTWFKSGGSPEGGTVLIGSGNLTLRGLQSNTEMFGWIDQDSEGFTETLRGWNRWIEEATKDGLIYRADDPAVIRRAKANKWRSGERIRIASPESHARLEPYDDKALMISAIPRQRSRGWTQFAMAKRFYDGYFGFEHEEMDGRTIAKGSRRVLLHAVKEDGTFMPAESRRGNISGASRNFRMEIDGARNVVVDPGKNPMVVFVKTGQRDYVYQVVGTDSPYHEKLIDFARRHNSSLKKNEGPKCWCDVTPLREEMPELAIFRVELSSE